MKTKQLLLAGLVAAATLTTSVYAEKGDGNKGAKGKGGKKAVMEKFDTDGDGELSDSEKEAMKAQRKEIRDAVLAKFDADGDGKLSEDERSGVKEWVKTNYPDAGPMGPPKGKKGGKK